MRKLKVVFTAVFLVLSFASLFSVVGCKKTTTNVTKDSVYYSPWIKLAMTLQVTNGDSVYIQDLTASKLTAAVIRSGAVLSYLGSPYQGDTAVANSADQGLYPFLDVNTIELQSYGYLNDFSFASSGLLYRYVIIPGNVLASTSLKNFSQEQLHRMTFTDVQKATNGAVQGR